MTSSPTARSKPRLLAGRCACGTVEYEVADAFRYAANCHCSDCRRATGAACKPFAAIERERLRVTRGADWMLVLGEPAACDMRCAACGSLLYSVVREGQWVHVALGSLSDAPSVRPSAHIFVGSKAPWHTITDDLPQYERHREAAPA